MDINKCFVPGQSPLQVEPGRVQYLIFQHAACTTLHHRLRCVFSGCIGSSCAVRPSQDWHVSHPPLGKILFRQEEMRFRCLLSRSQVLCLPCRLVRTSKMTNSQPISEASLFPPLLSVFTFMYDLPFLPVYGVFSVSTWLSDIQHAAVGNTAALGQSCFHPQVLCFQVARFEQFSKLKRNGGHYCNLSYYLCNRPCSFENNFYQF